MAAASLTIVPSASDASWGVVGGGEDGRQTPASASRAPSCIPAREARGGNSVTSALTAPPSLASFSPFVGDFVGGGGAVGGGGGVIGRAWTPLQDRHATGKSTRIPLLKIENNTKKFCLGWIGRDGHCFCPSTACNTMTHKKKKHDLGCKVGWFIPTQSRRTLSNELACFLSPFLDDARLTNDVKLYLASSGISWWKTTAEWEEFMIQAKAAWHAHLIEQQHQAALQGAGGIPASFFSLMSLASTSSANSLNLATCASRAKNPRSPRGNRPTRSSRFGVRWWHSTPSYETCLTPSRSTKRERWIIYGCPSPSWGPSWICCMQKLVGWRKRLGILPKSSMSTIWLT